MQQGKDSILLVQSTSAALAESGYVIGNSTEHTHSMENELIDENTKFGRILGYGQTTESFDITAYGETADPGQKAIIDAIRKKKQIKLWEVDLNLNENGKHNTLFAYALVETLEKSAPQDGFVEVSSTVQVIGNSVEDEIDPLPPELIEFATYGFEAPGASTGEFPEQEKAPTGA